ncbi:Sulfotransferase family cytosolic 2B member 1, partial [Cuculus canorus]
VPYGVVPRGPLRWAGAALTATSPGTTWMQEILTLLFSRGDVLPAKTIPNWERAPWLEQIYFREALQDTTAHRLITTHLPARVLAPALQQSKAKVRGALMVLRVPSGASRNLRGQEPQGCRCLLLPLPPPSQIPA